MCLCALRDIPVIGTRPVYLGSVGWSNKNAHWLF